MVLFSTLALAGLTAAAATLRGANTTDSDAASSHVVAGAFILECESSQSLDLLIQAVQEQGGSIRRQFNSRVFYGVSVELRNTTVTEQAIKRMPGVTKVWPVEATTQPVSLPAVQESGNQNQRRDSSAPWNHVMTQVDRLHAAGFTGSGIRIAIVDTGVDYTHSALGGCFGKGCRVALGDNLARDGKANDPMDCVGHGTAVAGILGGNDANYVGVAPNATLAAYRVLDCNTFMVEDDLVAGWLKAYEDGAQIIVSSAGWPGSGWATRAAAVVVSRIVDSGVPCIVGLGNDKESGLFSTMNPSSGRGVTSVNAFARASGALDGHVRDAPMARFSSYGPNWDLDIKPTVGSPGDDVPSIQRGGGYTDVSGTSFAGPLVAGILALMAEVRGTFDPVLLNSLLSSTAVPQGPPYSVAQQGGGLVRAWDAAHATTLVEPASLAFNDTLHRAESLSLRITNTGRTNATYHLGSIAADTLYTVAPDGGLGQSAPARETADVKLSQHVLILGPGESASVDISATDPTVLDAGRLPVWSGWISINSSAGINGSDGGSLTIPYLGLSGSLKEHTVLPSNGAILSDLKNEPGWGPYDKELFDGQFIDYEINNDGSVGLHVPLRVKSNFGSPLARVEVVPISPRKWLVDRLQSKNLKLDAFSLEGLSHNSEPTRKVWNGRLPWGDYLPMGRYKLAVRALRVLGDSAIESDWDLSETVEFFVSKGPGEKACEIYEPGKTIPEKALFVSREECLQVQGSVGAELPWVLAPQEATASTRCTDDNITAEYCGSYRFCKAHDDTNLSSNLKSPFSISVDCARSYKPLPVLPGDDSRLSECGATRKESPYLEVKNTTVDVLLVL
ncbi:subtilisin-like serine protease PR1C [Cordyceps javanica]|nr:subtilisin-like serine protease PR1C [Cordyceps javanica]